MRNIPEFIMLEGKNWQVKHRCNYNNIPEDWRTYKALTLDTTLTGKEVLLLHSCGLSVFDRHYISVEQYYSYISSLKIPKGYRAVTYKDVEDGKDLCLRDSGDGTPSHAYDYNDIGNIISGGYNGPRYISISTSPSNTHWVRLHDLCIKR